MQGTELILAARAVASKRSEMVWYADLRLMTLFHQHNSTPSPGGNRPFSLEVATWDIRHPPLRKDFICIATTSWELVTNNVRRYCQEDLSLALGE